MIPTVNTEAVQCHQPQIAFRELTPGGLGSTSGICGLPNSYGVHSNGSGSYVLDDTVTREVNEAISYNEMITSIRSELSLQVKELAEILHVQRATIYSWKRGEAEPSARNRQRIEDTYDVSLVWRKQCNLPAGNLIRRRFEGSPQSMIDLLKADTIDKHKISEMIRSAAAQRRKLQDSEDADSPTISALAKKVAVDFRAIRDRQDLIDAETGKRISPD